MTTLMKMWYHLACLAAGAIFVGLMRPYMEGPRLLLKYHQKKEASLTAALWQTMKSLFWIGYLLLYQKMVKNVESLGCHQHDVHYALGDRNYKIRVFTKRGPRKKNVIQVIDADDNDVTHDIMSYLGPSEDWHGVLYRPSHFRHRQLTFNMADGQTKTFHHDEPILLFSQSDLNDLIASLADIGKD